MNLTQRLAQDGIVPHNEAGYDILIDTADFEKYCIEKHGYTSDSWDKEIWVKFMIEDFFEMPYKSYSFEDDPDDIFEELINSFLTYYPEFGNKVSFIFLDWIDFEI